MAGTDPDNKSFRELALMARGASRARWQHTSHLLAMIANCHRDPNKRRRPFDPREFNPFTSPAKRQTQLQARAGESWQTFKAACAGAGWIGKQ